MTQRQHGHTDGSPVRGFGSGAQRAHRRREWHGPWGASQCAMVVLSGLAVLAEVAQPWWPTRRVFSRRVNDLGALPGCGLPALWPTSR